MTDFFPGAMQKSELDAVSSKSDHAIVPFIRLGDQLKKDKAAESQPESRDILIKTIEGEIIPRLMLTLKDSQEADADDAGFVSPTEQERSNFLWSIMNESAASSRAFVSGLIGRGVSREAVYLDLLTGAARRLGEMWDRDEADFTDVTIGLCRLHQILRDQGAMAPPSIESGEEAPKIVLATISEDQHVFGVVMVSEFFRRAGWRVWSEPAAPLSDLSALLAREWFDAIGLSAACESPPDKIASEIKALRQASKNPQIVVLVGGGLFNQKPELVKAVGADATAADGKAAVELGRRLVVTALQHG